MPDELKDLKRLEKVLIFTEILFKKIAIMHGKGEFSKIKGSIWNLIETTNICNFLPSSSVSNGLIVIKLKLDFKYRGHVYFEPASPHIICKAQTYLKSHNKFYRDIAIANGLLSEDMFTFSSIVENQGQSKSVAGKIISDGKEISKNINGSISETMFPSVEDPLNKHRTASNETTLVSEISNIRTKKNTSFDFKWWILQRTSISSSSS